MDRDVSVKICLDPRQPVVEGSFRSHASGRLSLLQLKLDMRHTFGMRFLGRHSGRIKISSRFPARRPRPAKFGSTLTCLHAVSFHWYKSGGKLSTTIQRQEETRPEGKERQWNGLDQQCSASFGFREWKCLRFWAGGVT